MYATDPTIHYELVEREEQLEQHFQHQYRKLHPTQVVGSLLKNSKYQVGDDGECHAFCQ